MSTFNRIDSRFASLKKAGHKAFVPFLTFADPSLASFSQLLRETAEGGADIIEIGVPFSDPMADGVTTQASYKRALEAGSTLKKALETIRLFRADGFETPIVLMGYFNPVLAMGLDVFCGHCHKSGVDGVLLVDLPPEEEIDFTNKLKAGGTHVIRLITPTTTSARLKQILPHASGFLYFVSVLGITGTQTPVIEEAKYSMEAFRLQTQLPIILGFGIKTPEMASHLSQIADGVVVGSSVVGFIQQHSHSGQVASKKLEGYVRQFVEAVHDAH